MHPTPDPEPPALSPADIAAEYAPRLTTQEYRSPGLIDGVRLIPLRGFADDGGSFAELMRFDERGRAEPVPGFQVRQSSFSVILPGAMKAFHLHYAQDDVWFVPPADRLLVGLLDARADSPTRGLATRHVLGAGVTQLLYIPRGVAHGAANLGGAPASVFYFVNQQFDAASPDERRLPHDLLGEAFWAMTPG